MFDLANFDLEQERVCADALRTVGQGSASMEEAAARIVRYLYENLVDGDGQPACALVRLYKTHRYGDLPAELKAFAEAALAEEVGSETRCLTLVATAGLEPDWNDPRRSRGHRAIPLPSEQMVERFPMISRLVHQLGLDVAALVAPPRDAADLASRTYDVFHVEEAAGSPHIPAQADFVERYGIRSAVGFGGVMLTGEFYAVVLFSLVPVTAAVARTLQMLALAVRVPLLPFARSRIFAFR